MQDVLRRSGRFDLDEDVSCMRWSEVDKSNRHAGERALQSTIPGVSARFVTAPRVGRDLVRVPADLREVSTSRRARASRADATPKIACTSVRTGGRWPFSRMSGPRRQVGPRLNQRGRGLLRCACAGVG